MDGGRKSIPLLEGCQDSSARPSGNGSTKMKIYEGWNFNSGKYLFTTDKK